MTKIMKPLSDKPFVFKSVNKMMAESFKKHWDLPALSNYHGLTLKYCELAQSIARLHIFFKKCGINPGDKIAICSRNQVGWGVGFLASLTYGAVPVPLLHEFRPETVQFLVNHSKACALFAGKQVLSKLDADQMPELKFIMEVDSMQIVSSSESAVANYLATDSLYDELYPKGLSKDDISYRKDSPDELALINYTSGTSGAPKGVMIPYRALSSNIQFAMLAKDYFGPGDNMVSMLPSAHMYGMMFEFIFEMTVGVHTHFLQNAPSPKIILASMAELKPRIVIAVPLIIEKIYKGKLKPIIDKNPLLFKIPIIKNIMGRVIKKKLNDAFGGQVEEVIVGGAAFNPEVEAFLKSINFNCTVGYGMTEGAPIFAYANWKYRRLGSCGIAAPWNQICIDSPDPVNIPGEVCIKGPNVFLGYYLNDEATRDAFTKDGWMRTGDMGVLDKDGYLYLKGRCKCMILGPSGQNIYPEELEATINSFNNVLDSLVIEDGGSLKALIYPDWDGAMKAGLDKQAFIEKIKAMLPQINNAVPVYAHIKTIEVLEDDFERTPKRSIKRHLYVNK